MSSARTERDQRTGIPDDENAATQTLNCKGPFEVLQLSPSKVYEPLEVKRQYWRLALILHPDKNRHRDAEPAFKKLTAAFENLHDPARQALSRAEAEHRRGGPRHNNNRGSSGASSCSGDSSGDGSYEYDASAQWGGSQSSAEAPRWCREGEYVPEAEREKEASTNTGRRQSRPVEEFMEDFEQQEKAFKEEVAQAKERNAQKKRAKAEARLAADQERMDRLREDVLGSSEDAKGVEAKTASWHKFISTAAPKRRAGGAASGRREKAKKTGGLGLGHGDGVGQGNASAGPDPPNVAAEKEVTAGAGFVCWVCRRGFRSAKGLANHEAKSELHEINVQLREVVSP
eukprot:g5608.t1